MAMDIVKSTKKKVETSKKKLVKTMELKSYRKLAVNFLILTANLIIVILYFSLSQAKVEIIPARETVSHSVAIAIAADPKESSAPLAIAGSTTAVEVSHTQEFAIDTSAAEDAQAEGMITVSNTTTDRDQLLVANTRFKNEAGILLKTREQVTVPRGKELAVAAYADKPGVAGEVSASAGRFQIVALPHLKDKIYAKVYQDFTGGTVPVQSLTQSAYDSARAALEAPLLEKGRALLSQSMGSDIDPDKLTLNIADARASAQVGDRNIQSFSMTAKGTVSAFTYDEARAREIIKQELIKQIPADKLLLAFDENSYTAAISPDGSSVTASLHAELAPKIPEAALKQEDIVGMNEDEVRLHFTKITGIRDVQIEFWPFWVRSVPNLKDHVNIEIKK